MCGKVELQLLVIKDEKIHCAVYTVEFLVNCEKSFFFFLLVCCFCQLDLRLWNHFTLEKLLRKTKHACLAAKCEITDASMNPACYDKTL